MNAKEEKHTWNINPEQTGELIQQIEDALDRRKHAFTFDIKQLGRCTLVKFALKRKTEAPVFRRRHRLSAAKCDIIEEKC